MKRENAKDDLRILFVGARIVGHRCLQALLEAGAHVAGLLYLDESKAGVTTAFTTFDDLIEEYSLHARPFSNLHEQRILDWAAALQPEVGMVVGVSQLIGPEMLALPRQGFIGMHPTLLPEGRGRAPIPWTLIKGLKRTGVSLFWCDPGADTGDLLVQTEIPVFYEDTAALLGERVDRAAARLLVESLPALTTGTAPRLAQDESRATVWPRRCPEDGLIDWAQSAGRLYDWVRALTHPYPGAFTFCVGRRLWIWGARESADEKRGEPGEVLAVLPQGLLVATATGNLLLTRVQWDGEAEVGAENAGLEAGSHLGDRK